MHYLDASLLWLLHLHLRNLKCRPLKDAIETRWAIRGLTVRLQLANSVLSNLDANIESNDVSILDFTTPNLNARMSNLPFDIFPHCLPWQMSPSFPDNHYYGYPTKDLMPEFLQSIPFNFDTPTTRTGNSVIERTGTAWLAEQGVGALAYSGKYSIGCERVDERHGTVVRGAGTKATILTDSKHIFE